MIRLKIDTNLSFKYCFSKLKANFLLIFTEWILNQVHRFRMSWVKIVLYSNRGSYEESTSVGSAFNQLVFEGKIEECFTCQSSIKLSDIQSFVDKNRGRTLLGFIGYGLTHDLFTKGLLTDGVLEGMPAAFLVAVTQVKTSDQPIPFQKPETGKPETSIQLVQKTTKEKYIEVVRQLKHHIQIGDIYEVNYCMAFEAENIEMDPTEIWEKLQAISPMPFAALIDHPEFSIISASPERFIKKEEDRLYIQPMKGTIPKGKTEEENSRLKTALKNDPKERSENVMIVDLTRNDLSKIASKKSVQVDELFGVYSFHTINQMISTISCIVDKEVSFTEILEATFPMGSMTGAPKTKAIELIHKYESFNRGPFSGMLGYINPQGDFDFSVLIRTIFYDKKKKKIFLAVGSAITSGSDVEKEYEECLIKLQPLLMALNARIKQ